MSGDPLLVLNVIFVSGFEFDCTIDVLYGASVILELTEDSRASVVVGSIIVIKLDGAINVDECFTVVFPLIVVIAAVTQCFLFFSELKCFVVELIRLVVHTIAFFMAPASA